jgi:hypothetical protein
MMTWVGLIFKRRFIIYSCIVPPQKQENKISTKEKIDLQPYVIIIIIIIPFFTHQLQTLKASVTHFFHHNHFPSKKIHVHLEKGCVIIIILIQLCLSHTFIIITPVIVLPS